MLENFQKADLHPDNFYKILNNPTPFSIVISISLHFQ